MDDLIERLAAYWGERPDAHTSEVWHVVIHRLDGLRGASADAIRAFEMLHGVRLPSDMREFLLRIDGTVSINSLGEDKNAFSFWPLADIKPVRQENAKHAWHGAPDLDGFFVFADYMQWSWAYAIRLTDDASTGDLVIRYDGTGNILRVAASFREFAELTLSDAPELYRGRAAES